jgi:4'-phosphopantetheinyl transferase
VEPNGARWPAASATVAVQPGHVHVWSAWLDGSTTPVDEASAILSADELDRAARFHFDRHRRRFVCARGALRQILGWYLDVDARELSFAYGPHGKPALSRGARRRVSFNVSHSDDLALIAVAPEDVDIGVDVEAVRSMPDGDDIACRFFAPSEVARLRSLPAALREPAFFQCWTRKEAYLKALGDGLARPLDRFEVTFGPDEPGELRVIGDERESARWTLVPLEPEAGFAAALVATRGVRRVECWDWTGSRATGAAAPPCRVRVAV